MISQVELVLAKEQLLSGKTSIRQLAEKMNVDREKLKELILQDCNEAEKKELEQVLLSNKANNKVELDANVKEAVIKVLQEGLPAKKVAEEYGINYETLRRKAEELANSSPEYIQCYIRYKSKRGDYSGIDFRRLFIELIEEDSSQTDIANKYGIPARTMSRELEKIGKSEDETDSKLYNLAKIYAERHEKHEKNTVYESQLYKQLIEEIKANVKYITIADESQEERRIRELHEFKEQVESLQNQGFTKQQIAEKMEIGISTIRRRLLELEELEGLQEKRKIVNNEGTKKNQDQNDEPDGRD